MCQGEVVANDLLGGRYRLDSVLGRGGMAVVWRGVDTRLDRPVAVKVLDGAALAESGGVQRFHQEARTVARLTDPHVVSVYDVGSDGDRHYLVMELVHGESLAALLANGPLPVRRAVEIAAQVCEALGAAHVAGVVHRDVKPGNILIDDKGRVKVCDFGIARLVGAAQPQLTAVGAMIGTSQYMAPEQVSGGPVDARTDLYALGCVLYTMLAGVPPFQGEAAISVAWQQLHHEPEPIAVRRPEVPAPLAALVDRLLAKDPGDRPGSAAQVRAALVGVARTGAVTDPGVDPAAGAGTSAVADPTTAVLAGTGRSGAEARTAAVTRATAAVSTPTRTLPAISEDVPPPHEWRSRPPWALPAALTVAALLLVGTLFALWDNQPEQGEQQSAGGAAGSTVSSAPATPPATSPPALPSADEADPAGWRLSDRLTGRIRDGLAERITAARQTVADAVQAGRLDPKTARHIDKELDRLERELAEGDDDKLAKKTRDVARELEKLRREGKLDTSDWESLWPGLGDLFPGLPVGNHDNG